LSVREHLVAFAGNRCGRSDPWTIERVFGLFPHLEERAENQVSDPEEPQARSTSTALKAMQRGNVRMAAS
jgi:ABC-type branched-subunit amino acid transport system ATPase component